MLRSQYSLTNINTFVLVLVPLEWIAIWVDAPAMTLVSDLRQGALYAMMFSFWIIFVGEHLMVCIHSQQDYYFESTTAAEKLCSTAHCSHAGTL